MVVASRGLPGRQGGSDAYGLLQLLGKYVFPLMKYEGWVGLTTQPASPFRGFALLAIGHALVLYGLTYSLSRYAVPLRPLLAVALAWAATHRGAVRARLRGDRRVAAVAGALAAWLLVAWARDLPLLVDLVARGGKGFPFVRDALP